MKAENFYVKTADGYESHSIDTAGNHFIDGRCVNPQADSGLKVGSTYPPLSERLTKKE